MTLKRKSEHALLKNIILALTAVAICVIVTAFFVAWIAAKSGAPIPTM